MKRMDEQRRNDFVQLVMFLLLSVPADTTDIGQLQHRLHLLRTAQVIPGGQIPGNLTSAAWELATAEELPAWAVRIIEGEMHWWPPEYGELDTVPACAPVVDPLRYAGWHLTRDAKLVTCPRCMMVAAGHRRAHAGGAEARG